jgi:hypothetical protein
LNASVAHRIAEWLRPHSDDPSLSDLYNWRLTAELVKLKSILPAAHWVKDLSDSNQDTFHKTLSLREHMISELATKDPDQLLKIARWIIEIWGGIRRRDDGAITKWIQHRGALTANQEPFRFNGIASWSKYAAFMDPTRFAIYDARAVYTLNWLLFRNTPHAEEKFFPLPLGRNSVLEILNYDILLVISNTAGQKSAADLLKIDIEQRRARLGKSSFARTLRKRAYFSQTDAYPEYCRLLRHIGVELYGESDKHSLTKVEMALFSVADRRVALEVVEYFSKI